MVLYQYFIAPKTVLTESAMLDEIPGIIPCHSPEVLEQLPEKELNFPRQLHKLYSIEETALAEMFKLKFEINGNNGSTTIHPVDFFVYRRLDDSQKIRKLAPAEIATLVKDILTIEN